MVPAVVSSEEQFKIINNIFAWPMKIVSLTTKSVGVDVLTVGIKNVSKLE